MTSACDYINEVASSSEILQFMFFTDDSIEVQFKDQSLIQLSPCGANYQYCRALSGFPGMVDYHNAIKQRCMFATSETKKKVGAALKLRNFFASRPFVPKEFNYLSDADKVHLYKDVTSFYWDNDSDSKDKNACSNIIEKDNGQVSVTSKYEHANLNLSFTGHHVFVNFLAKVSSDTSSCTASDQLVKEDKKHSVQNGKTGSASENRRHFVWLKHIFPVQFCPAHWKYPLALALEKRNIPVDPGSHNMLSVTHSPRSLSNICKSQFRHHWSNNQHKEGKQDDSDLILPVPPNTDGSRKLLKVLWSNCTVYWINTCLPHASSVEVWLNDGSLVQSISAAKQYFRHIKICPRSGEFEVDRTYFPTALPVKPRMKNIILRSMRLLTYVEESKSLTCTLSIDRFCWQDTLDLIEAAETVHSSSPHETNIPLAACETAVLPGLGKFSAINGNVQVLYEDGTTLYTVTTNEQLSQLRRSSYEKPLISCRLLMPDGAYQLCSDMYSGDSMVARYTQPACDWIEWLLKTPTQRAEEPFYSDTMYASDKLDMISNELEKICRFNVLSDITSSSGSVSLTSCLESSASSDSEVFQNDKITADLSCATVERPCMTVDDVAKALSNTSKAISDIDNVLKVCRE